MLVKDFRAAVAESESLRPVSRTVSVYARTMYTDVHDNWTEIKCWQEKAYCLIMYIKGLFSQ